MDVLPSWLEMTSHLRQLFGGTAPRPWTPLIAGAELSVQIGHLAQCLLMQMDANSAKHVSEVDRNIGKIDDELADILLQILSVMVLRDESISSPNFINVSRDAHPLIPFLLLVAASGQLIEALMTAEGFRHQRNTPGEEIVIHSRYAVLLQQCHQLAEQSGINLSEAFQKMCSQAEQSALSDDY